MPKITLSFTALLFSTSVFAQSTVPVAEQVVKNKGTATAVTREGLKEGRMNLIIQNASTDAPEEDAKYKVDKLQAEAIEKSNKDAIFKQRQFELGAEILPFIAPWINEIAKPCMDSIKVGEKDALTKSADCTAKAVETFKKDPSAFLNRLPASDRAKLEAIAQEKIKSSAQPVGKATP